MFADRQGSVDANPYLLTAAQGSIDVPGEAVDNLNLGLRSVGVIAFAQTWPNGLTHLAAIACQGIRSPHQQALATALEHRAARDGEDKLRKALRELHQFGNLPLNWAEPSRAVRVPGEAVADSQVSLRAVGLLAFAYATPDGAATIGKILSGQPEPGDDDITRRALQRLHEQEGPDSIQHATRELLDAGYLRLPHSGDDRG